jgi:hypothetical protein
MATMAAATKTIVTPCSLRWSRDLETKLFFMAQFSFRAKPMADICDGSVEFDPKRLETRPNLQE